MKNKYYMRQNDIRLAATCKTVMIWRLDLESQRMEYKSLYMAGWIHSCGNNVQDLNYKLCKVDEVNKIVEVPLSEVALLL